MVAMAVYRGKLHRVPADVPREWPMPPRALTLHQFKILTQNRDRALARQSNENNNESNNPNPQPDNHTPLAVQTIKEEEEVVVVKESNEKSVMTVVEGDVKMEVIDNSDVVSNKEKRKRELEEKLKVLNDKKHQLVQMLKQILNAEEEIKRRNAQAAALRSSISVQGETAVDMGSVTRHIPKLTVDVNFSNDLGGESDAVATHNAHERQLHHMRSTSPSAASLTRPLHGSFQQNALLSTPRASLATVGHGQTPSTVLMGSAATASPSRFAPTGHQGQHHSTSLPPPVSVSATQFVMSSPSPAASAAATSGFRDSRLTSPS